MCVRWGVSHRNSVMLSHGESQPTVTRLELLASWRAGQAKALLGLPQRWRDLPALHLPDGKASETLLAAPRV